MTCPHPEKQRHYSRKAALKARDGLERAKGLELGLEPYWCECRSWHLGHRRKRQVPGWARRAGLDQLSTPANDGNTV